MGVEVLVFKEKHCIGFLGETLEHSWKGDIPNKNQTKSLADKEIINNDVQLLTNNNKAEVVWFLW